MNLLRLAASFGVLACSLSVASAQPSTRLDTSGPAFLAAADHERITLQIPSVSLAVVDSSGVIWSGSVGAEATALYRWGAITELLTDFLVMQRVESGQLDLDAPVRKYLPEFAPHNPFSHPITLRLLMAHRAGLVREPPRGHYFDTRATTLQEVVRSLNSTTLVAEPGTVSKYSSAGIAVLGRVLEVLAQKTFDQLMRDSLLEPLGMRTAAMSATAAVRSRLAHAQIAPFDTERVVAPVFDLGTAPANNLYASTADMGAFAAALLNGLHGLAHGNQLLDGHRLVEHDGAVYGHTTDLSIFPDDGIAVIVAGALDDAHPVVKRLRNFVARSIFAARAGKSPTPYETSDSIPETLARQIAGHYINKTSSADVRLIEGHTFLEATDTAAELRRQAEHWVLSDATTYRDDIDISPETGTLTLAGKVYHRQKWAQPAPPDADLAGLIGDYGWEHNYLRIYERDGHAYVRTEWSNYEPLQRIAPNVYRFENAGSRYAFEHLKFIRGRDGNGRSVYLNGIVFERRDFGAELGAKVHALVRDRPDLRANALRAQPPRETGELRAPDLVQVTALDPTIRLDIRYASANNFMGTPVYESARAFLQRPAAEALVSAHRHLAEYGYGVLIHDAYRPWFVTKMFWDATPPEGHPYVADPSQGSRHNRGCAADITLYDLKTGAALEMTGRYDEMSARSSPLYVGGTSLQRWRRDLLRSAVEAAGYSVYKYEWWHFDYHEWQQYPLSNFELRSLEAPLPASRPYAGPGR